MLSSGSDLLTAVTDGTVSTGSKQNNTVSYDEMGNPTRYLGATMTWAGKQLKYWCKSGKYVNFAYNEDGIRTLKNSNGVVTNYYYNGSLLIGMTVGSGSSTRILRFSYDSSGSVVAVDYSTDNGTTFNTYYYLRNAQNDIVKLIDSSGSTVVEYCYDSWGKPLSTSGSLASTLGKNNPFRYRGYVYDEETGFYYLQSRYYNPEVGRFISSDVLLSTGQGVLGHNAYAYCLNNPVNMSDNCGSYAEAIKPLDGAGGGSLGIGIGIGSLILAIISAITNITTSKPKVKTEKEQAYFTTNPMDFNPVGLTRTMYPGTKNGAIIKWCDPTNGATVFEWNEDLKHGSHYHVFMPNLNGLHDGTHYYPGQRVPEPWNSLYF